MIIWILMKWCYAFIVFTEWKKKLMSAYDKRSGLHWYKVPYRWLMKTCNLQYCKLSVYMYVCQSSFHGSQYSQNIYVTDINYFNVFVFQCFWL